MLHILLNIFCILGLVVIVLICSSFVCLVVSSIRMSNRLENIGYWLFHICLGLAPVALLILAFALAYTIITQGGLL